jgi:hypothetical protein
MCFRSYYLLCPYSDAYIIEGVCIPAYPESLFSLMFENVRFVLTCFLFGCQIDRWNNGRIGA